MPLAACHRQLIDQHLTDPEAISAIIFGLCWPNDSTLSSAANLHLQQSETLDQLVERYNLGWSPRWLTDAGFTAFDAAGTALDGATSAAGEIHWSPALRTCRLDDQIADTVAKGSHRYRRRTSAEFAVLALWTHALRTKAIQVQRPPENLSGGTRGALFRDLLIYFLQSRLPPGWLVRHEVPLTHIRGLHMRRDVGDRKSDILIIDSGHRLVAALSSKWTWRSDRGTEAAQMVPLTRYRPDVPYAMATAEFPRAASVARESIEDRTYHLCPAWVGAWITVNDLAKNTSAKDRWPDLASLHEAGKAVAATLGLKGLDALVEDLKMSGDIL